MVFLVFIMFLLSSHSVLWYTQKIMDYGCIAFKKCITKTKNGYIEGEMWIFWVKFGNLFFFVDLFFMIVIKNMKVGELLDD